MIRSAENLSVGDTFEIGNTSVVVTNVTKPRDFRATHVDIALETLYSDSGRILKIDLKISKNFLIELFNPESQE